MKFDQTSFHKVWNPHSQRHPQRLHGWKAGLCAHGKLVFRILARINNIQPLWSAIDQCVSFVVRSKAWSWILICTGSVRVKCSSEQESSLTLRRRGTWRSQTSSSVSRPGAEDMWLASKKRWSLLHVTPLLLGSCWGVPEKIWECSLK